MARIGADSYDSVKTCLENNQLLESFTVCLLPRQLAVTASLATVFLAGVLWLAVAHSFP